METLKSTLFISILVGSCSTQIYAENITFNGAISESSCSKDSSDIHCKNVVNTVERIKKSQNSLNMTQILSSADKKTVHFNIQPIDNKNKKILTISYL